MSKKIQEEIDALNSEISDIIKYGRKKAGMSQGELARRLKVDQSYVSRLEKPGCIDYSISTLYKISDIFNMDMEIAFFEKEKTDEKS